MCLKTPLKIFDAAPIFAMGTHLLHPYEWRGTPVGKDVWTRPR
jgi:hypothetical protein